MSLNPETHSEMGNTQRLTLVCTCLAVICFATYGSSQTCFLRTNDFIYGKEIRASVGNTGTLFQRSRAAGFQVPFEGFDSPAVIYAAGLWIGGKDENGEVRVCAATYEDDSPTKLRSDYGPGPLAGNGGTDVVQCEQWSSIWTVTLNDILAHIEDFESDGVVDNPRHSVYGWPGSRNEKFEEYNGFALPNRQNFGAPFLDINGNSRYEPHLGEYPHPRGTESTVHPAQISWTVFNDNSTEHLTSYGTPLELDVQLTAFTFDCAEDIAVNETVFVSYDISNRGTTTLEDVIVGQWMDGDVGCPFDDYLGCDTLSDTYYYYNTDQIDGGPAGEDICESYNGDIPTYGVDPPVVSCTFFNRKMTSFSYYNAAGDFPNATQRPAPIDIEFYRYLTGVWRDGTPMSVGGDGYNVPPTEEVTKYAFSSHPQDTTGWSMYTLNAPFGDRRAIGTVDIGTLEPGEQTRIELAFAYHRDTTLNTLGNVTNMLQRVNELRGIYAEQFNTTCSVKQEFCVDDCVYPGDTDNDGRVGHLDFVNVSLGQGSTGPKRHGPVGFVPLPADNWAGSTQDLTNFKHLDCNGDGIIDVIDTEVILEYYDERVSWYETPESKRGFEIRVEPIEQEMSINDIAFRVDIILDIPEIDSMYGLGYVVELNDSLFSLIDPSFAQPFEADRFARWRREDGKSRLEVALYSNDLKNKVLSGSRLLTLFLYGNRTVQIPDGRITVDICINETKAVLADGTILDVKGECFPLIVVDPVTHVLSAPEKAGFVIYPNPSGGQVYLDTHSSGNIEFINFYDTNGRLVHKESARQSTASFTLPPGMYIVVADDDYRSAQKLIVID